jgi:hypothetical protein
MEIVLDRQVDVLGKEDDNVLRLKYLNSYLMDIIASKKGASIKTSKFRISIISVVLLVAATNLYAEPCNWQFIPHVAAGGGWTSYLTVNDPHGLSSRAVWVYFYDDAGNALPLKVNGVYQSSYSFTLEANQEKTLVITADSTTYGGQVQIKSQGIAQLNASLRFASLDASGNILDAVGVLPTIPNFNWSFAIDKQSNDDMGVGIAYPWTSATTPLSVSFDLYQNGTRVSGTSSVTQNVAPMGHLAIFVSQLFPGVAYSGTATLKVSSTQDTFSAIALRVDKYRYQYSSLAVNPGVQSWTVTLTGIDGLVTWSWRFINGYTFVGAGSDPENATYSYDIKGICSPYDNYFQLTWWYTDSLDNSQGVMIYQGTYSKEGGIDVINGTRQKMRSDGTVLNSVAFKATRTS